MCDEMKTTNLFAMDGHELRGLLNARIEELAKDAARLEAFDAQNDDEREVAAQHIRGMRRRIEDLTYMRDHVADGVHTIGAQQLAKIRTDLRPIEPVDLDSIRRAAAEMQMYRQAANERQSAVGRLRDVGERLLTMPGDAAYDACGPQFRGW